MADIAKLDYSKPPPGYLVHDLNDDGWWWRVLTWSNEDCADEARRWWEVLRG